jgi:hypothetical protein
VHARRFYKYLDVRGARLTLQNRTFKHATPSTFNDASDMTVERIFPEDEETAAALCKASFHDIFQRNLNSAPTCRDPSMRTKVAMIQQLYREHPEIIEISKKQAAELELTDIYDLDRLRATRESVVTDINKFLQGYRVLCVCGRSDLKKMWELYAQNHTGIAIAISPNEEKDSKYLRFQKVKYEHQRPCLYESAVSFFENRLFGDQHAEDMRALDRVIYTKTKDWEGEHEYRLVIPMMEDRDWNLMPFHPEEIVALYLGARISDDARQQFISLAKGINPKIEIYQCVVGRADSVAFCLG